MKHYYKNYVIEKHQDLFTSKYRFIIEIPKYFEKNQNKRFVCWCESLKSAKNKIDTLPKLIIK